MFAFALALKVVAWLFAFVALVLAFASFMFESDPRYQNTWLGYLTMGAALFLFFYVAGALASKAVKRPRSQ